MRIIVYGSLRRKQGNSHWMTNAQWLGDHQIEGFELYSLGHYPGVIEAMERYIVRCTALMPQPLRSWMRFAPKGESTNVI